MSRFARHLLAGVGALGLIGAASGASAQGIDIGARSALAPRAPFLTNGRVGHYGDSLPAQQIGTNGNGTWKAPAGACVYMEAVSDAQFTCAYENIQGVGGTSCQWADQNYSTYVTPIRKNIDILLIDCGRNYVMTTYADAQLELTAIKSVVKKAQADGLVPVVMLPVPPRGSPTASLVTISGSTLSINGGAGTASGYVGPNYNVTCGACSGITVVSGSGGTYAVSPGGQSVASTTVTFTPPGVAPARAYLNGITRDYVQKNHVNFGDYWFETVDPTTNAGGWISGDSPDLLHPGPQGSRAIGVREYQVMTGNVYPSVRRQPAVDIYSATANPTGNLIGNPTYLGTANSPQFLGTGGNKGAFITGAMPDGWDVNILANGASSGNAAGAFTTASTTITMALSNTAGNYPNGQPGAGMGVYDQTKGAWIGKVTSYIGTTLTLTAASLQNSTGAADTLNFAAAGTVTASITAATVGSGGAGSNDLCFAISAVTNATGGNPLIVELTPYTGGSDFGTIDANIAGKQVKFSFSATMTAYTGSIFPIISGFARADTWTGLNYGQHLNHYMQSTTLLPTEYFETTTGTFGIATHNFQAAIDINEWATTTSTQCIRQPRMWQPNAPAS